MRLPSFDELPVAKGAPAHSSWGLWGEDDRLGCLNLLTPERALRGAGLVRRGVVFPLDWELDLPNPPLFGRPSLRHAVGHDDVIDSFNTQSSTQWDGFRHFPVGGRYYNGLAADQHGVDHWARKGIVTRGVLADVGRWRERQGRPLDLMRREEITAQELRTVLDEESATPEAGDVLLVRVGWVDWYVGLGADTRTKLGSLRAPRCPGLAAGEDMARTLWDWHLAAVASDTPTLEAAPFGVDMNVAHDGTEPFATLHQVLLPLLGIPIGELWDLRALAEDCAADGVYEFLLTSAPLHLERGAGSPPNVLAVK
jgi:hypothetical protein